VPVIIPQVLTLIVLSILFIQDFKSRSVYWFWFPILTILFFVLKMAGQVSLYEVFINSLYPMGFLLLQLLILTAYFSYKAGHIVRITNKLLGWGDIWLLVCLCFYFDLFSYVAFYVSSLIVVLIFWPLWQRLIRKKKLGFIPFAGLQSFILIGLFLWSWNTHVVLSNDFWVLNLLIR
jgi:hypothetical protein